MKILLAEDERSLSRAESVILERGGFNVEVAHDGLEALDKLNAKSFDACVLDIMMPGMDGVTVLRTIRERGDFTPVLLLTAKSEIDDKVQGFEGGANDYLTKPFDARELLARVRAMTHLQSAYTETKLHMGNITLDRGTNELSTPTGSFRLSIREMKVLELLLLNTGYFVPTRRFMERIFSDEDGEDSVVWMYISYLRKKLDALHADIKIIAKATDGYALESIK